MKLLLTCATYFAMLTAGYAATCTNESFDFNAPGVGPGRLYEKIEEVFPTFRDIVMPSETLAILWIDLADCLAPDLDVRAARIEAIVGTKVMLRAATTNFRLIAAYRYPEIVVTRKLKELFPSLAVRGNKIGENVEVLVVGAADFHSDQVADRAARAALIVGRPVELQLRP